MTGGRVVILGKIGRNLAAGMSGGVVYVLDFDDRFCNHAMVDIDELIGEEQEEVRQMIIKHVKYTKSPLGSSILENWERDIRRFTKIIPRDYKRMIQTIEKAHASGLVEEKAIMVAFEENHKNSNRKSGN